MPAELEERLAAWIDGKTGRLFPISARHAQRRIAKLAEDAGIAGASAHSLRHSFATKIYARTRDLGVVQRVLGHASIQTTTRYARATESAVRHAIGA